MKAMLEGLQDLPEEMRDQRNEIREVHSKLTCEFMTDVLLQSKVALADVVGEKRDQKSILAAIQQLEGAVSKLDSSAGCLVEEKEKMVSALRSLPDTSTNSDASNFHLGMLQKEI